MKWTTVTRPQISAELTNDSVLYINLITVRPSVNQFTSYSFNLLIRYKDVTSSGSQKIRFRGNQIKCRGDSMILKYRVPPPVAGRDRLISTKLSSALLNKRMKRFPCLNQVDNHNDSFLKARAFFLGKCFHFNDLIWFLSFRNVNQSNSFCSIFLFYFVKKQKSAN